MSDFVNRHCSDLQRVSVVLLVPDGRPVQVDDLLMADVDAALGVPLLVGRKVRLKLPPHRLEPGRDMALDDQSGHVVRLR
jgi:hypothetical protein